MFTRGLWIAAFAAMLVLLVPSGTRAQNAQQVHPTGEEDAPGRRHAGSAAAAAALEEMTSRSDAGLRERLHADGTVSVDLEGRYQSVVTAKRLADGSHEIACETHGTHPAALPAPERAPRRETTVVLPAGPSQAAEER
jgi:hypothetical protein